MADNVVANPGVGGATFATDDDGTAHWPYAKLAWGPNNTQTVVDVGAAAVPIQDGGNAITVDGTVTANAGTNLNTSALALEAGGNLAAAATSLAIIDDWDESDRCKTNTRLEAHTSGGWTPYSYISAAGADEDATVIKNAAGQLSAVYLTTIDATPVYIKFYNKATAPTEADTPVLRMMVPGSATGGGGALSIPAGFVFSTGIAFRMTTGAADADTGAVTAAEVLLNCGYK